MADLTEEEDKELKRTDAAEGQQEGGGLGIRRDFSVIHSKQLKKNHLFLGPARFVNVSPVFLVFLLYSLNGWNFFLHSLTHSLGICDLAP